MHTKVTFDHKLLPYLLLLPQLLITLIFFFWPAGESVLASFFREDAFGGKQVFVGLDNYASLLNTDYLQSIWVTLVFAVSVTAIGISLSLLLACMANRVLKGKMWYRTLLIIPYAIAPSLIGVLARYLFSPSIGVIARYMQDMGIDWNPYLSGTDALMLVVGAAIWSHMSYNFLFFLAGLQAIPDSLIEAAAIDGASPWQRFKSIVLPLLAPTTFFLFIVNMIYAFFETFALIDVMTQGGPGNSTTTMVYSVYQAAFQAYDYGSSGAQSVILMAIIIALTLFQFKFLEKKIHY